MKFPTRSLAAAGLAAVVVLASGTVSAQNVQTFDDQIDAPDQGAGDMALPGAPAPEQEPQVIEQQPPPADGEAEGDGETAGSFRINLFDATEPGRAETDELLDRDESELYQGVIPGERDGVDHLRAAADDDPNPITWVGFRPEDDRTRVFFQSPRPVEYHVEQTEGRQLVVTFEDATIADQNFSRFIDASHFDRAVDRIEVEQTRGGDVEVTLALNERVEPTSEVDGDYLYLDFPHDDDQ